MNSYLKVTVFPDFKKEFIEKVSVDAYKIYIKQPASGGRANKRVLEILQEKYPGQILRIVSGALTMKKLICITTPGGRGKE
jgi:uncharacterized protein YggU (UPF0235/DUF167 family)